MRNFSKLIFTLKWLIFTSNAKIYFFDIINFIDFKRSKNMYRIAICDDNEEAVREIEKYLYIIKKEMDAKLEIHTFVDSSDFVYDIENERGYDIVFLDIELGVQNGIDIAKEIVEKSAETIIIFITAYHQYIYDSFQVRPIGFIEKPFELELVKTTFIRALKAVDDLPTLNYSFKNSQYRVLLKKIAFLESKSRRIIIGEGRDEDNKTFYGKMDEVEKETCDISTSFCRISHSVIINMRYIREINLNTVAVEVGGCMKEFGISRKYKENVREKYMEFIRK